MSNNTEGIVEQPKIVTSSWFTQLPEDFCRIGISRGTPRGQSAFRMYRKLQPGPGTLKLPDDQFTERYFREVLQQLDPHDTVDELMELAAGKIPALLCFEHTHSPAWCHRAIVSAWLQATIGLDVLEFGREEDGCGIDHPKLCSEARTFLSRGIGVP
jgi:hypothetical protein